MDFWRRIKILPLGRLLQSRPHGAWRFERHQIDGRKQLFLRSPRGTLWEFKASGGLYVRRHG